MDEKMIERLNNQKKQLLGFSRYTKLYSLYRDDTIQNALESIIDMAIERTLPPDWPSSFIAIIRDRADTVIFGRKDTKEVCYCSDCCDYDGTRVDPPCPRHGQANPDDLACTLFERKDD